MRVVRLLALATLVAVVGLSACASSSGSTSTPTSVATTSTTVPGPPTTMVLDDIPYYADGTTLDAFLPDPRPARPVPAVVLVHGGGWVGGERGEWAPRAERFVLEQGWAASRAGEMYRSQMSDSESAFLFIPPSRPMEPVSCFVRPLLIDARTVVGARELGIWAASRCSSGHGIERTSFHGNFGRSSCY